MNAERVTALADIAESEGIQELGDILLSALKALADAGEAEQACRLAGRACVTFRLEDGPQWRRFNALLHRIAPRVGPVGTVREAPG